MTIRYHNGKNEGGAHHKKVIMMDTYFAPALRTDRRIFKNQLADISRSPVVDTLLKTMSGLMIILNEDRQIVAMNHSFLEAIGIMDAEKVLGLRLGESLHCVHAHEEPNGCGTTPHCRTCGAAVAMMAAITEDRIEEKVCALTAERDGVVNDICLLVRAQPVVIDDHRWIMIFAQDITQQQFWVNLERVFFHDINNILSSLLGNSQLLSLSMPDNEYVREIFDASRRLAGEISLQRSLSQEKDSKYFIRRIDSNLNDLRKEIKIMIRDHQAFGNLEIIEKWPDEDVVLHTDIRLVSRIIGNMLINASEATADGGVVKLTTIVTDSHVQWDVWNEGVIAEEVQDRIFQRHFSTKAKVGRGLGTYSMKLFGEKYLNGTVSFTSSREAGTTFTFLLPYR